MSLDWGAYWFRFVYLSFHLSVGLSANFYLVCNLLPVQGTGLIFGNTMHIPWITWMTSTFTILWPLPWFCDPGWAEWGWCPTNTSWFKIYTSVIKETRQHPYNFLLSNYRLDWHWIWSFITHQYNSQCKNPYSI